ncbi:hypothetical protein E2562_005463 [Oryza meyeriana var. granulata]|uniref:Uncharacterized protein n=1 Tax=Oryza meyeriana var. granulata TaxID=110450 RepID=A0A6G1DF57_9ORYZ|nr:hypothetical protein E2562_005463 [Oryza meyeriana var. granulata]
MASSSFAAAVQGGLTLRSWPENFSLLSYADLRAYLESQIVTTDKMSPTAKLRVVMSRPVQVATVDQKLANIDAFFAAQSNLPVLDEEGSFGFDRLLSECHGRHCGWHHPRRARVPRG